MKSEYCIHLAHEPNLKALNLVRVPNVYAIFRFHFRPVAFRICSASETRKNVANQHSLREKL